MDKILAFSILSSSPADISSGSGAFSSTRLSWRTTSSAGTGRRAQDQERPRRQQQQQAPQKQDDKAAGRKGSSSPAAEGSSRQETRPRFAPEFDGINCFESIVSF